MSLPLFTSQMLTEGEVGEAEANILPSGEKATLRAGTFAPSKPSRSRLAARSQSLMAPGLRKSLSSLAHRANSLPSGEKATPAAPDSKRVTTDFSLPLATSQRRTVLSVLAEASVLPSGEKARQRTTFSWPFSTAISLLPIKSQRWIVLSKPPVASTLPPGARAAQAMVPLWPLKVRAACWCRLVKSHRLMWLGSPKVPPLAATVRLSGEKATASTQ